MTPDARAAAPVVVPSQEDDETIWIVITGDPDVTLIDPHGRRDGMVNGEYVAGIPGCERERQVGELDVEGPPDPDTGPETIALRLTHPLHGPYRLLSDPTSSNEPLSIMVDWYRTNAGCRGMYDGPRVETLCFRWFAEGEECQVRIAPCED